MNNQSITMTSADHHRLCGVLDLAIAGGDLRLRGDLRRLSEDVKAARIVEPREIPSDIVTLNSRVVVADIEANDTEEWVITLPDRADVLQGRLSVLSPLGTALMGSRAGDEISYETVRGERRARVQSLAYQPEAEGRFDGLPEDERA